MNLYSDNRRHVVGRDGCGSDAVIIFAKNIPEDALQFPIFD